jgi:Tfp pilus assembly PilM family ATPase
MPRIFAIDWDRHEVRGLLLQSGPTGTSITGAWAASLDAAEGVSPTANQVGAALATAMGQRMVGKATTIIGVGRDHVQMKLLALPPAPADELPDMVRFQAEREFTTLGSDAALDFISLAGDAQTQHQVLAVALSPAGLGEAREVCQLLDIEPNRVVLRPCAAASLVHRSGIVAANDMALVVNPLTDEADLVVLAGGVVLLMRTVRLPDPSQDEARQRTLVAEIRRTLAAARQQSGDRQVDRVLLCGNEAAVDQADSMVDELEMSATMFDPAAHAPSGLSNQGLDAAAVPRFAAVLGMALTEADRRPPIVDFVNVRQRVAAGRFGRQYVLAAATAAIVALGLGFQMWRQTVAPARELAEVQNELKGLEPLVKQAEQMTAKAAAVERWLATDVTWLDGLNTLSQRLRPVLLVEKDFPVAEDLVTTQLTFSRPPANDPAAGRIDLLALAKSDSAVAALEERLRDEQHHVSTGKLGRDKSVPGYESSFGLQVGLVSPSEQKPPAQEAKP